VIGDSLQSHAAVPSFPSDALSAHGAVARTRDHRSLRLLLPELLDVENAHRAEGLAGDEERGTGGGEGGGTHHELLSDGILDRLQEGDVCRGGREAGEGRQQEEEGKQVRPAGEQGHLAGGGRRQWHKD
jgi:hypothetical protein